MAGVIEAVVGRRPVPAGVRYYSDAVAYVPEFAAPMLISGPGPAGLAHQPNEYVEIDRLVAVGAHPHAGSIAASISLNRSRNFTRSRQARKEFRVHLCDFAPLHEPKS